MVKTVLLDYRLGDPPGQVVIRAFRGSARTLFFDSDSSPQEAWTRDKKMGSLSSVGSGKYPAVLG
jgi:hypothetical protein